MPIYQRRTKGSHLDTVRYEIDMLKFGWEELQKDQECELPWLYLLIEGFLLHYRNLTQFFSGAMHKPGDLSTAKPEVWADRKLSNEEVRALRGPGSKLNREHWQNISQFLQHCTLRRYLEFRDWNLDRMYREIEPVIDAFDKSFPRPAPPSKEKAGRVDLASVSTASVPKPVNLLGDFGKQRK